MNHANQRPAQHGHSGVAQYLLGYGPMPPPRPQDYALAHIQTALDHGGFEQPWNHAPLPVPQQMVPPQRAAGPRHGLSIEGLMF